MSAVRGRPRDPAHDQAILEATLALAAQEGYSKLTMEEVARRAGVGRPSIYRRWRSKQALLIAAYASRYGVDPLSDTGSLKEDLLNVQYGQLRFFQDPAVAKTLAGLLADLTVLPDVAAQWSTEFIAPRRESIGRALKRAATRGEVRSDYDLHWVCDLLAGPYLARKYLRGSLEVDRNVAEGTVSAVMAYLARD